jgi:glycosyltransferase involved in cell wall biosynthesis
MTPFASRDADTEKSVRIKTLMLDGYNLALEKGTGVATYARNLSYCGHDLGHRVEVLYGTRAAPGINKLIREIAFFDPYVGRPPAWLQLLRRARQLVVSPFGQRAVYVPITGKVIATTFRSRLPYFDRIWNVPDLFGLSYRHFRLYGSRLQVSVPVTPSVMHWTYPLPLRVGGAKNIYTMHDLVPLRLPFTTLDNKRRYFKLCRMLVRRADHIVTVSEASRRDIINLLGAREDKVTNTYQAVDIPERYANKPESHVKDEVEGSFGLPYKGYMLFYGAIEPKKNIGRLIEAYLASNIDTPLVVLGAHAWKSEEELRLLYEDHIKFLVQIGAETHVKRRVIQLGYAPFPLLVSIVRGAKALLFPSLYEGFGLPVLEAMKLGTPVLTSDQGSIPEIAEDAAILVDPYDARAMANAIRALDTDADLRGALREKGMKQAAKFSVDAYAARLKDLYERL